MAQNGSDVTVTDRQLVGRNEELAALVELLDAPEELSRVAVLSGEAGIGKTSLWLAGIDAATAHGYRILSSRPSEAETGLSFAGLADLLGNAPARSCPSSRRSSGGRSRQRCCSGSPGARR